MRLPAANPGQLRLLRRQLAGYRRVLPSLDLKRRQLAAALAAERQALAQVRDACAAAVAAAGDQLPMLAALPPDVKPPVTMRRQPASPQIVAGIAVPGISVLESEAAGFDAIGMPAWLQGLVDSLREAASLQLRATERAARAELLDAALRRASQRVNLLEKLLIPRAARRLRAVEVLLGDLKRSDVIRAKLAKSRRSA